MSTQADLLSRLIKYVSNDRQRHVENFLTEVLVAFLNRLAKTQAHLHREFIFHVLLAQCPNVAELTILRKQIAYGRCGWRTQEFIPWRNSRKIADLVLFGERGRPLMLVENKVNARVAVINDAPSTKEQEEKVNQLHVYGRWLNRHNRNGALVLLTHAENEPPDFHTGDYGVNIRATAFWVTVTEWLSRTRRRIHDPIAAYLSSQLDTFLETEGIVAMQVQDIKRPQALFTKRAELIGNSDRDMLVAAEDALFESMKAAREALTDIDLEWTAPKYNWGALLCWAGSPANNNIEFGFGFTHGSNEAWCPKRTPAQLIPFAYVLAHQGHPYKSLPKKLAKWGIAVPADPEYPHWFKSCSTEQLFKADGFNKQFAKWVAGTVRQAKTIVDSVAEEDKRQSKKQTKKI